MAEKNLKSRIVLKHDTEANWLKATNFIPLKGEVIIYDKDASHNYDRIKVGDGTTVISSLPFIDDNKVDKVSGKGLSTNDYTTAEKNKLAGIATGANKTTVDSSLSTTSTNPVQNKIVTAKLNEISGLVGDTSVSSQISTAIANKVDKVDGKGLSTNDYTTAEKNKLSGIASGAEVNQNAFANVKVGTTTIVADEKSDTLELAGSNVTITPDATNDKVTIGITKANVTSALGYTPPTTNTTYSGAGSSLGLVKTGGDVTIADGVITVNDDSHNHVISNIDGLQDALDDKAASSHGTHVSYSTTKPVMDGTASVGTASTVARSDHKHPTDTSRAAKSDLDALSELVGDTSVSSQVETALNSAKSYTDTEIAELINGAPTTLDTLGEIATAMSENADVVSALNTAVGTKANASDLTSHTGNTTVHITSTERTNWNAAKTHADTAHAPSNAEANQNAFSNIIVGSTTIAADQKTDSLTLVAGSNVTLTPDASNDKITIAAKDTVYTHPNSGVSAGTYKSVTVNASGHVTAGANPTTLSGYGITDAATKSSVDSLSALVGDTAVSTQITSGTNAFIKGLSVSGKTITYTKGDGSTGTITTQDTNTTYSNATTSAAGLMSTTDKAKMNYTNIAYGTCSTAAATAAKVITVSGNTNWALTAGSRITIKFSYTNTASNPTFNVNGTGAKSVWYNTTVITTSMLNYAGYANRPMDFVYDGTQYVFTGWSVDSNNTYSNASLGQGYGTCATAEATTAKTVTLSSYALTTGGVVAVKFTYAVPASATLNVNSKGAKSIYYRGAAITAGVIKAGDIATFIYNGSQYHLLTVDRDNNTTYSNATTSTAGLMSAADKTTLNELSDLVGDESVSDQISAAIETKVDTTDIAWTQIYDSGAITTAVNAISGINVSGYKRLKVAIKCVNTSANPSGVGGAIVFTGENGRDYVFANILGNLIRNTASTSGGAADFRVMDNHIVCEASYRAVNATNMLSDEEGAGADNLSCLMGGGYIKCTSPLTTMMVTNANQATTHFYGVGSRVVVWGCKS